MSQQSRHPIQADLRIHQVFGECVAQGMGGTGLLQPGSPMGETGRVAATLQKMGIGGCGLAAPSIDEGEPAMVRRALLIIL